MTLNATLQLMTASSRFPDEEHDAAVRNPQPGHERALRNMIAGWLEYSQAYTQIYEVGKKPEKPCANY